MTEQPPLAIQMPALGSWLWNSQLPPPLSGQVRTDSRDWVGATQLNIDRRMSGGSDVSSVLAGVLVGDSIRMEHQTDPTRSAQFRVLAAPTRVVDAYQYQVLYQGGEGAIPNSGTRIALTRILQPLASSVIAYTFEQLQPSRWRGVCNCKHGVVQLETQLSAPSVLDPAQMVQNLINQHDLVVACECPYAPLPESISVAFSSCTGCQPGTQRIVPQVSAVVSGPNFFYGGPAVCGRFGAYVVEAKLQLSRGSAQGASGVGRVLLGGQSVLDTVMSDEGGLATANLYGLLNMYPNLSVVAAYDNTSSQAQDVQLTTLRISAAWVP